MAAFLASCQQLAVGDDVSVQGIKAFALIEASTSAVIEKLSDASTLDLAELPDGPLNIVAETRGRTGGVSFSVNGSDERYVAAAPYKAFPEAGEGWRPEVGTYLISARPDKGGQVSLSFTVVDGNEPVDPAPDDPAPDDPAPDDPAPDDPAPDDPAPDDPAPNGLERVIQEYGDDELTDDGRTLLQIDGFEMIAGGLQAGVDLQHFKDETNTVIDAGAFAGWDLLHTPHNRTNGTYMIRTSRDATIGIGWLGNVVPSWLDGWTDAGQVQTSDRTMTVYTKRLPAGVHHFGDEDALNSGPTYVVLGAEPDGSPTPVGAHANGVCPDSVHDRYLAEYPDGSLGRAWHPKIDPVEWCYFDHEHGSDPADFGGPALGPLDVTAGGMPHPGYKVMTLDPYSYGGRMLETRMVLHMGTSGAGRRCARFHAFNIDIADASTGDLLLSYRYNVDTGPGRVIDNPDGATHLGTFVLTPPECPTQGVGISPHESGARDLRFVREDRQDGYEGWKLGLNAFNITGLEGSVQPTVVEPATVCDWAQNAAGDYVCNLLDSGKAGAQIWVISRALTFDPARAPAVGRFCTDIMFREVIACSAEGAVEQYVNPALSSTIGIPTHDVASTDVWSVGNPFGGSFSTGRNINSRKWVSPFPAGAN